MAKLTTKRILFLLAGLAFVGMFCGAAWAYTRPANPTMDYAPQNIGIYDTYYKFFEESDCRVCHGASTAETHHGTWAALTFDCIKCHSAYPDVVPAERDCKKCHLDAAQRDSLHPLDGKDYGKPHHASDPAASDECTECHNQELISKTFSVAPPSEEPTDITPTPYSCENCHWPTGDYPDQAAVAGYESSDQVIGSPPANGADAFLYDWMGWPDDANSFGNTPPFYDPNPAPIQANGWPKPTMQDGQFVPAPIEANGPVQSPNATLHAGKAYKPADGTHHNVGKAVYTGKCYNCHWNEPGDIYSVDENNPYLIRYCENCHDILTLHNTHPEHATDGGGLYTVGGVLDSDVYAYGPDGKCAACHGDEMVGEIDPVDYNIPDPEYMEPHFGSPGMHVTVYGSDFGDGYTGDEIVLKQEIPASSGNWFEHSPGIVSWTDHEIEFVVPGLLFDAGRNIKVQVNKGSAGVSKTLTKRFTLHKQPNTACTGCGISASSVGYGAILGITGEGFRPYQEHYEAVDTDGDTVDDTWYGFATYVQLHASADAYRFTKYNGQTWSDANIDVEVLDLLDVNTLLPVPEMQLYTDNWELMVYKDYFIDKNPWTTGTITEIKKAGRIVKGSGTGWSTEVGPGNELEAPDGNTYHVNYVVNDTKLVVSEKPPANWTGAGSYTIRRYNKGLNGLDNEDETGSDILLQREISNPPESLNIFQTPVISGLSPDKKICKGDILRIYGYNFGNDQSPTSEVRFYKPDMSTFYPMVIKDWTNTKIKVRVKKLPATAKGKKYIIRVYDGGGVFAEWPPAYPDDPPLPKLKVRKCP